jgi:ElaA protein
MTNWSCKAFTELSNQELYKILQLRASVFVVEQNCPYQDCDDKDQASYHLMGWQNGNLVTYTRILPPGLAYKEPSIGRVVTSSAVRRTGIGRELMTNSIEKTHELFGKGPITIGAQLYLKKFYESFGFKQIGDPYLEDGIEHIKMKAE